MPRYRIQVVEEVQNASHPAARFRARPDLSGNCEGDCPSTAKRVAKAGIAQDKRFRDLEVISTGFRDKLTIHVVVRSKHNTLARGIPGRVHRSPV